VIQRLLILLFVATLPNIAADYGSLALAFEERPFEENQGTARFVSRAPAFNLFVCNDGAVMALAGKRPAALRMRVVRANAGNAIHGEAALPGQTNYLIGKEQSAWRTNLTQYGRVRISEILPLTDLVFYGTQKDFEFDLVLHAGADPRRVALHFDGAVRQAINSDGSVVLETVAGSLIQHKPRVRQDGREISARYRVERNGDIKIVLGQYDRSRDLVIDPVISYSTYLGSSAYDSPNAIAVDSAGNAYVAGETSSFTFPTTIGALKTAFPPTFGTVAFVSKINSLGTALIYSTYLGGSGVNGGDAANAIAIDSAGNAYVTGTTGSADFPVTAQALSGSLRGATDAFVAKLNPSGNGLVYSTYFGGSGSDSAAALAIDATGSVYITGSTGSTDLSSTPGAISKALKSANDAFVAKINPAGSTLVYSTYLGGSLEDDAYAIAVDATGNAYVAGSTVSQDFPVTAGSFQTRHGTAPVAFIAKVNPSGTGLGYSTLLGGTFGESANAIAIDGTGAAYVAGTTYSYDFPTSPSAFSSTIIGPTQNSHGFASKINPTGTGLVYSTFVAGNNPDSVTGLALDSSGNVTLTGFTYSTNFPVSANSLDPAVNFAPAAFLTKLNPTGSSLVYSTLLGASGASQGQGVAIDSSNHAYVAGYTSSHTFPVTQGALQSVSGSISPLSGTGFISKIDLGSTTTCTIALSPTSLSIANSGGPSSVSVSAPAGCFWEAFSNSAWITVNPPSSGLGAGSAGFSFSSNATSLTPRNGTITVGGVTETVSQAPGSCSAPQFFPASQAFPLAGGVGSLAIALPGGCTFTAVASTNWITVNPPAGGAGNGLISYSVAANTGVARNGAITFGGASFPISQGGNVPCTYSVAIAPGLTIPAAGGTLTATVTTGAGCTWTSSSSATWLKALTASGAGSGSVSLQAAANGTNASQTSSVAIAGQNYTVTQNTNTPPTMNSVTPTTGSGTSQTFTFQSSDPNGYQDLSSEFMVFISPGGSCAFYFNNLARLLYVFKLDGSTVPGPLSPGSTSSITNGQCTATGLTVTGTGSQLTVAIPITFTFPVKGLTTISAVAYSQSGLSTGAQTLGTYNVTTIINSPPTMDSVTPTTGLGTSQTFTFQTSDPNGYQNLESEFMVFISPGGSCAFYFNNSARLLYVFKLDGSGVIGPLSPGSTSSITNGQCTATGFTVNGTGNQLTVAIPITFTSPVRGITTINAVAYSRSGLSTGAKTLGTYNVATIINSPPTMDSVTPATGSGTSQTFAFQTSDPNGYQNLESEFMVFISPGGSCAFYFNNSARLLYLFKLDGSGVFGPLSPGSTSSITNGQCTATGLTVTGTGNQLTVAIPITFTSPMKGVTAISAVAYSQSGLSTGAKTLGTYNVTTP
jgi:hypothetical protein